MLSAAILAGGLATRLRPLTETIPKSLVPINGEPFAAHQMRLLREGGVEHVVMCVAYMGDMIQSFLGDGRDFGLIVDYSWDGPSQLGTAGAIRNALPLLGENFLVMYGDSYLPCDYLAAQAAFLASGKPALMTVYRNDGKWDSSNVEYTEGRIVEYDKKHRTSRMCYIDYGLGMFKSSVFSELPEEPIDLATVYQDLLVKDELAGFEVKERFYEVGSFEGIGVLSSLLASKHNSQIPTSIAD